MATLQIRKKSLFTWEHIDSQLGTFILSKFYFSADGTKFQIVEQGQAKRRIYDISEIEVYDIGGSAETFANTTLLSLRLEELKYPAYNLGGVFTFDPANYDLVQFNNNDADPFARVSQITGGVSPKYATLTSSQLTSQDITGFVTYANALSPNLSIAANEIYDFVVTDTEQIFKLYKSGVTIGLGQTPITSADVKVIELSKFDGVFKGDRMEHQATGAAVTSFGAAAPTVVGSATNSAASFASAYDTAPNTTWNRRVSNTAATAGSSAEFYDNASVFCANGLGYYFSAKLATSLRSTNSRSYVGLTGSNATTGNVNPSTLLNMISVAFDSADLHWYIMHNDGSGTATKVDTGFVLDKASALPTNQRGLDLTVEIWNFYGSPNVYFKIHSLRQNKTFFHVATTNLPGVNTGLTYHLWANNGTDNVAVNMVWSNILIQRQS